MPTYTVPLPQNKTYAFAATTDSQVVVKVLGTQVEYGEDLSLPREGVIAYEQEMVFTSSKMLRAKDGDSSIELTYPDLPVVTFESPYANGTPT